MLKPIAFLMIMALVFGSGLNIQTVEAKTTKKPVVKKVVKKQAKKTFVSSKNKKLVLNASYIPSVFSIVSCAMPDGKTIKVPKKDCDAVTAFWASVKPSSPSNNSGGGGSSNSSGGSSSSSSNSNNSNSAPAVPAPSAWSVILLPCTSSSCSGISTIKIEGSNFTANSKVELIGSSTIVGVIVGGDSSTKLLVDFINVPAGIYDVKISSTNGDRLPLTIHSVVVIK